MNIALLILAAGSSSRLGQSKQLLQIGNETLLEHSVKTALHSDLSKVIVVLGANEKKHREYLENFNVEIVFNADWKRGMGNSLKAGLNAMFNVSKPDGIIIMVCDQPLIKSENIENLISKFKISGSSIIASRYSNTLGVSALFTKVHFQKLLALDDDQGAKKIIQQHLDKTEAVEFPEGVIDIDTLDDYQNLIKQLAIKQKSHL